MLCTCSSGIVALIPPLSADRNISLWQPATLFVVFKGSRGVVQSTLLVHFLLQVFLLQLWLVDSHAVVSSTCPAVLWITCYTYKST